MKFLCIAILVALAFFILPSISNAQTIAPPSPEKIYLQLDGQVYTTDQTIWFKAIVTSRNNLPTDLSGVLYVELIAPEEKILEKKLIKLENGIGNGSIQLFENYSAGKYLVRAFTQWNKNFGDQFIFQQYINIFSSAENNESPIRDIVLSEMEPGKISIKALLLPSLIDSLHKGSINSFVTVDGKTDSLVVRKDKAGDYRIDYSLTSNSNLGIIGFIAENGERVTRHFAFDTAAIDLQFFPESGSLVHGIASKVGFKATGYDGKGKFVEGNIVSEDGKTITSFKSNHLGMGAFILRPEYNKRNYAIIKADVEEKASRYPLPEVSNYGYILSITKSDHSFKVIVSASHPLTDSIYLDVRCREHQYYLIKGKLKNSALLLNLPSKALPEGVVVFKLMDKQKQPLAERIFFNENQTRRLDINIVTDKDKYFQREETSVNINITNLERNKETSISLMVINNEQLGALQGTRENILSYFLMSSELKGEIEDPGYYFAKDNPTCAKDLDVLMLTQGWRKYNAAPAMKATMLNPEYGLSVSGTASGALFQNSMKKGIELTLLTVDKSVAVQNTDSLGKFYFPIKDAYGTRVNFLIQTKNSSGKKKDYTIALNEMISPEVYYKAIPEVADVTTLNLVKKNQERKNIDDQFKLSGTTMLQEVVINAPRFIPLKEEVTKKYGEPDVVIDGDAIRAKEKKWSYGLYSVLLYNFGKDIVIYNHGGVLYATAYRAPTLILIDGIPVVGEQQYKLVPDIPPSEVLSFEIIRNPLNFLSLFRLAYPEDKHDVTMLPTRGSIISIYTKGGHGLFGAYKSVGILHMSIPGFTPQMEFYKPRYEKMSPADWTKPDLRALAHWEPQIKSDHHGKASCSFYNADNIGDMKVIVEAISEDGRVGYKEINYSVKGKK